MMEKYTKKKYLVKEFITSYDGRGDQFSGEVVKFITENPFYAKIKKGVKFQHSVRDEVEEYFKSKKIQKESSLNEWLDDMTISDELHAENGYTCSICTYKVKEIDAATAIILDKVIKDYKKI